MATLNACTVDIEVAGDPNVHHHQKVESTSPNSLNYTVNNSATASPILNDETDWISIKMDGKTFTTTRSTLTLDKDSVLSVMFSEDSPYRLSRDNSGNYLQPANRPYLLDRNPRYFEPILNYLRTGELIIDPGVSVKGVWLEAKYFNIVSIVEMLDPVIAAEMAAAEQKSEVSRADVIKALMHSQSFVHQSTSPTTAIQSASSFFSGVGSSSSAPQPTLGRLRLQGMNLAGIDLSGLDLSCVNFARSNLEGAKLCNCTLDMADMRHANLTGADFTGASMARALLQRTVLHRAKLTKANLISADLSHSDLTGACFSYADLTNANLSFCQMKDAELSGTVLKNVNFKNAILYGVNRAGVNLSMGGVVT